MAPRCDHTVDKKRVNSCVPKHLFLEGVEQPKISPKKPGNALSDALLMSRFQNFNSLIRINSGPNILKSCFFHWYGIRGRGDAEHGGGWGCTI